MDENRDVGETTEAPSCNEDVKEQVPPVEVPNLQLVEQPPASLPVEESKHDPEVQEESLLLPEPPVAPPRKSPSRRKRLLGKRARKKTGGEAGEPGKKIDPTTSEEECENEKAVERKEDQWKREDEEKRKEKEKKERLKKLQEERDKKDIEEWTKILQQAKTKTEPEQLPSPITSDTNGKSEQSKDAPPTPWWKFWKKTPKPEETKDDKPKEETTAKEIIKPETKEEIKPKQEPKQSKDIVKVNEKEKETQKKENTRLIFKLFSKEVRILYGEFKKSNMKEWNKMKISWNKCMAELLVIIMLCGMGAFIFRFTEGAFENFYKCGVKRVKRDFIEDLWKTSTYLREDEWKSKARRKLMEFEEQLGTAYEAGVNSYSGNKSWSFINSLLYSLTVITTIGYGHIAPATTTGKALTIVYAVIGIPLFLILLADFGKLFTRGIKWIWAFVRRLYYTGSCKKVRKTAPVQEVMKGVQLVYDIAAFRRPSSSPQPGAGADDGQHIKPHNEPDTIPSTPAPSNFVIDEEFNLPISLAIFILVLYIFCGAVFFCIWEEWSFFDSFYFVFISMSTIGFGDLVPKHKMYMMASIVYLAFGLALTSMCINVVQEKLSDTFRQASAKIGATIGLKVKGASGEEVDLSPNTPAPVELAQIHLQNKPTLNPAHV